MAKKLKPILPSLREKKRYLAFEIISKSKIRDFSGVSKAVWASLLSFMGEHGTAKAGAWVLSDKYNPLTQRGIVRVNHKHVDSLKASLTLIKEIDGNDVIVRSITVSGMLNKASKYIGG